MRGGAGRRPRSRPGGKTPCPEATPPRRARAPSPVRILLRSNRARRRKDDGGGALPPRVKVRELPYLPLKAAPDAPRVPGASGLSLVERGLRGGDRARAVAELHGAAAPGRRAAPRRAVRPAARRARQGHEA